MNTSTDNMNLHRGKRRSVRIARAAGFRFLTMLMMVSLGLSAPLWAGDQAKNAQVKWTPLKGDPHPLRDQIKAMRADQKALMKASGEGVKAQDTSTVNPNFGGFRSAPWTAAHAPGDSSHVLSSVVADFNNDGNLDVLTFQTTNATLMLGDGRGGFTNGGSQTTAFDVYHPVAVDLNHDGYLDVVAMTLPEYYEGTVVVLMNQKNGTFAAPVVISKAASVYSGLQSFNLVDVDGDGNLDVVISGTGTQDSMTGTYLVFETIFGNGDGTFRTSTQVETLTLLDYKDSLDLDGGTVVHNVNGQNTLFAALNVDNVQGYSSFMSTQVYELPINANGTVTVPAAPTMTWGLYYGSDPNAYLSFQDVNNDGVDDLIFNQGDGQLYVALGNSDGTYQDPFAALPATTLNSSATVVFSDVDGDGNVDAVIPGSTFIAVYPGNGDGTFRTPNTTYIGGYGTNSMEGLTFPVTDNVVADFNGDGKLDVVYFDTEKRWLLFYKGLGQGNFVGATDLAINSGTYATNELPIYAALDLNGDGAKDILVDSQYGVLSGINDGRGNFTYQLAAPLINELVAISSVTADFNKDGKEDAIFVTEDTDYDYHIVIATSNGDGTMTTRAIQMPVAIDGQPIVAVGDINGDGYPDLAFSVVNYITAQYGVYTMLNDGTGNFTAGTYFSASSSYTGIYDLKLADVTGDGLADLFLTAGIYPTTTVSERINPGNGDFSTVAPQVIESTLLVEQTQLKDVNGDGKLDLMAAVWSGDNEGILYYPGNGNGGFGDPVQLVSGLIPGMMDVNDYNGDGVPDVIYTNEESTLTDATDGEMGLVLLRGTGNGGFAAPVASELYGAATGVFTVDLANTGSPSILAATPGATTILLNQGATTVSLSSSASQIESTSSLTAAVTVSPYYSDMSVPTGSVTLLEDGAAVETETLDAAGHASFTLGGLVAGAHTLAAQYAGDANYNVNLKSGTATINVTKAVAAFTLSSNTNTLAMTRGSSGSATLTLTANSAFAGPVALTCSGAPQYSTCSFDQSSVTLSPGQAATAKVTVVSTTSQATAMNHAVPASSGIAFAGLLCCIVLRRKNRILLLAMACAILGMGAMTGCGSGSGVKETAQGSYAVTVTATPSDTTVAAKSFVLAVNITK